MRTIACLFIAAATCAGGCVPPAVPSGKPSYKFEIRGADGSFQGGQSENFSVTTGGNEASVYSGQLIVNGRKYGAVNSGDSIVVDKAGLVKVNGTERTSESEPGPVE